MTLLEIVLGLNTASVLACGIFVGRLLGRIDTLEKSLAKIELLLFEHIIPKMKS